MRGGDEDGGDWYAWTWRKGSESLVEDIMVVGARGRAQPGIFENVGTVLDTVNLFLVSLYAYKLPYPSGSSAPWV